MRHLGPVADQQEAQRLGDYLKAMGVDNTAEEGAGRWVIWVHDDDRMELAKTEYVAFLANPADPKYIGAGKIAKIQRAQEEKRQLKLRKNYVDVRTSWARSSWTTPPLTLALIIACLIVATLTLVGYRPGIVTDYLMFSSPLRNAQDVVAMHQTRGFAQILHGQVWRLLTPIFLHFGPIHLIFNLFWLRDLGSAIERRKGWLWLSALVLLSGILGNIAQDLHTGPGFGGMSGVVYGLFGYVWLKGKFEPWDGLAVGGQTVTIMLLWLAACIAGVIPGLDVANAAHVVGLAVGVVLGGTKGAYGKIRRRMRMR